jgi:hypothetical protein
MIKDRHLHKFSDLKNYQFYLALGSTIAVIVLFFDDWKPDIHSAFVIGFTTLMIWKTRKSNS